MDVLSKSESLEELVEMIASISHGSVVKPYKIFYSDDTHLHIDFLDLVFVIRCVIALGLQRTETPAIFQTYDHYALDRSLHRLEAPWTMR